jgi:small-conductance mechanosensitive channel
MAEYKPGEMDIRAQEKTFEGFIRWTVRVVIVVIAVLIFLAVFNA